MGSAIPAWVLTYNSDLEWQQMCTIVIAHKYPDTHDEGLPVTQLVHVYICQIWSLSSYMPKLLTACNCRGFISVLSIIPAHASCYG